jgi:hypothetical protein
MRLVNMSSQVNRRGQGFSPRQTFEAKRAQRARPGREAHLTHMPRGQPLRRHLWSGDRVYGLIWSQRRADH